MYKPVKKSNDNWKLIAAVSSFLIFTMVLTAYSRGQPQGQPQGQPRGSLQGQPHGSLPAPPADKVWYFQHIHKSAGTTICNIARDTMKARDEHKNCNVFVGDDVPCCGSTPEEMRKWALERPGGYNFVANEQYMYDHMDTEAFAYVFNTRDPRARMVSDYLFVKRFKDVGHTMDDFLFKWDRRRGDNYMVRCICGERCYNLPCGALTEEHLQYAMDRLERFTYVFTVEELEYTTRGTPFHAERHDLVGTGGDAEKAQLMAQLRDPRYDFMFHLDDILNAHARKLAFAGVVSRMDLKNKKCNV